MTKDEELEAAYLAGFNASGEGYNGEYPFEHKGKNCTDDPIWCKDRDNELAAIKQARLAPVQEPVHQWRQKHSPYWYDGYPDNDDGGGPYETRILYATPPAHPAPVQEPFGYLEIDDIESQREYPHNCRNVNLWHEGGEGMVAIYTTPPAQPAVPDAFGTREGEHPQYIQGWNDCRAEMLSMRKRVKP